MNLLDVMDLKLINMNLQAKTKDEAILELSKMLYEGNKINDLDQFVKDVYVREAIGETGMGNHIAIPHGHSEAAIHAGVAVGKVANPLEWESLDDEPVKLIFLIAAPKKKAEISHIGMLSQLASVLAYEDFQNQLMTFEDNNEFLETFKKYFDEYSLNRA